MHKDRHFKNIAKANVKISPEESMLVLLTGEFGVEAELRKKSECFFGEEALTA